MVEHALIDGDIVAHRIGFTCENDEFWVARARCDDMLDRILLDTGVTSYDLWLSDKAENNFRYDIYPQYKANRIGKPRPRHLEAIKEYMVREWGAKFAEGMEADDYLGILQDEDMGTTVICSIDKDLKQVSGKHYNFVKEEWDEVSRERAIREFYKQLIIGDVSDNIPGAYGMGPVKASKSIDGLHDMESLGLEDSCFNAARQLWKHSLEKEWGKDWDKSKEAAMLGMMLLSGRLLKIRRSFKEELWHFPPCGLTEIFYALSIAPMGEENGVFMEPTMPGKTTAGFPSHGILMEATSQQTSLATLT